MILYIRFLWFSFFDISKRSSSLFPCSISNYRFIWQAFVTSFVFLLRFCWFSVNLGTSNVQIQASRKLNLFEWFDGFERFKISRTMFQRWAYLLDLELVWTCTRRYTSLVDHLKQVLERWILFKLFSYNETITRCSNSKIQNINFVKK